MKTLTLFNAVVAKPAKYKEPVIDNTNGLIIEPNAIWAEGRIRDYYAKEKLDGNDLNKTFHKSWNKIKNSSRFELFLEQIQHYISTYGSDFKDDVYIPNEILNIPDVKLTYKVIKAYSKKEITNKCLNMLRSGVALKEKTINDLLSVLVDELGYTFTGDENIKNKEAVIKIADLYRVLPKDTMEFFRYIIYRATGESLLIKSPDLIGKVMATNFNPGPMFMSHGLNKLAEVFNRFKPLFLAFKKQCPRIINEVSKLSKTYHKPLIQNPLNFVTSQKLKIKDIHWLENATPYALFKAMQACIIRSKGQEDFVYRIRNGKCWAKTKFPNHGIARSNYLLIRNYLQDRFDLSGETFFFPQGIEYAIPTSEKMFVGNIPTGTKFYGEKMAVGIYWRNDWGARDLDLSGINIGGKVGWNATYSQNRGDLMYSGDIVDAPNGAVEYLYANEGLLEPTLVKNNVYMGKYDCDLKIIIGCGDNIDKDYMMNPNKLFAEIKCKSIQKQTILGMLLPEKEKQCFILLNFGAGHSRVSGTSEVSEIATRALFGQYTTQTTFKQLIILLGGKIVNFPEQSDYDLSLDKLEKDSFIKMFKE